ncbi:MAG: signal transduction histidine kinase [Verrucomicrobiales bacterium]
MNGIARLPEIARALAIAAAVSFASTLSADPPPNFQQPVEEVESGLSGFLRRLDPRVRRVQQDLEILQELSGDLPNPRIELRQSQDSGQAALFSIDQADTSGERPFLEFRFDRPRRVDEIYLIRLSHFFELLGKNQRFSANRSDPGHFEIEIEAGGKRRLLAIGDSNSERVFPVRLPIDEDEVSFLRLGFGSLSGSSQASLAISEILILSGEINLASRAEISLSGPLRTEPGWDLAYATDGRHWLGPPVIDRQVTCYGFMSAPLPENSEAWVELEFPEPISADELRIFPGQLPYIPGPTKHLFPQQLLVQVWADGTAESRQILDWSADLNGELGPNALSVNLDGESWKRLRITGSGLSEIRKNQNVFALGEVQVIAGTENLATNAELRASSEVNRADWNLNGLTDGQTGAGKIAPLPEWLAGVNRGAAVQQESRYLERRLSELTDFWRTVSVVLLIGLVVFAFVFQTHRARSKRRLADAELRQQLLMDLHDEFGGNLGVVALIAGQLKQEQDNETFPQMLDRKLDQVVEIVGSSRALMRRIVMASEATRPPLVEAIESMLKAQLDDRETEFDTADFPRSTRLGGEIEEALNLIARESIHNCAKHSGASRIEARLALEDSGIRFELADNGRWKSSTTGSGIGLRSLERRAKKIGGDLSFHRSEKGTRLRCFVPDTAT